jgi:hypothetical protein
MGITAYLSTQGAGVEWAEVALETEREDLFSNFDFLVVDLLIFNFCIPVPDS